ncbi:hypothetical protein [Streptomyces sp. NPDC046751]|uniref:hypothetical protein n=1 Tax=unclassified Streptomyces TaxID=2593676 RepID=UPI0033E39310
MRYQDSEGLRDSPPLRLRHEPSVLRTPFDDLDLYLDAHVGDADNRLFLGTLVDQGLADGPVGVPADLAEQDDASLTAENLMVDLVGPTVPTRCVVAVRRALQRQVVRE